MLTPVPRGEEKARFFALVAAELRVIRPRVFVWTEVGSSLQPLAVPVPVAVVGREEPAWHVRKTQHQA